MRETIEAAPTMRLTFDNDWHATVTADPLPIIPRFSGNSVDTAHYADVKERERFLLATFGSQERLLTSLRDRDVLNERLEARIGIAPDVAFLVQHGTVVGWSLTDPARYLTQAFAAPDPNPPFPATRRLLTECLDLITEPVIDDVMDGEPAALARLRAADQALRTQHEDCSRATRCSRSSPTSWRTIETGDGQPKKLRRTWRCRPRFVDFAGSWSRSSASSLRPVAGRLQLSAGLVRPIKDTSVSPSAGRRPPCRAVVGPAFWRQWLLRQARLDRDAHLTRVSVARCRPFTASHTCL
ncbi:hypothetical protein ACIQCQ_00710 [Streptomyces sp. NPDC088394]|uniref:hypothetical protein n=1 Tax=Streptomyces sp. NPDC088394 TaxID=3365860 RepID=UPI0037F5FC17